MDGVMMANEVIGDIKTKMKSCVVLKLDFEKAYDMVQWNLILTIIDNMGFGVKWHDWIRECLSKSRASVLLNGNP